MFSLRLDPPEAAPRLAVIEIDRPGAKVNTLTPRDLRELEALFDAIDETPELAAVILISRKPGTFVVGVDLEVLREAPGRDAVEAFLGDAHRVLERIASSRIPVIAAIDGHCLGGGLELALACARRIAADTPRTVLGLPQVELGLFPALGGSSRLPRMIGLRAALELILSGRRVRARRARKLGLVDEVVAPEALLSAAQAAARAAARALARDNGGARRAGPRDRALAVGERLGRSLILRQARKEIERRTHGLYPAPLIALDVIGRGLELPLDRALALEAPAYAELAVGATSRALVSLYARSRALQAQELRDGEGAAIDGRPCERLGLVGGGFMGADIAVVAAERGIEVRIREIAGPPLARALARADAHFARRARSLGEAAVFQARARVSGGLTLAGFATMDLIIEAVPEVLELKQEVFAQLEAETPASTILASNTSALPITDIGARLRQPERLVGLHFFSPVSRMPLLEIIRTEATAPEVIARCLAFARQIGKTPIIVRDGPGFYTTRVLGFYLMGALEMLMAGHTVEAIDEGARRVGWPVGPIALLDEVGIDVGAKVAKTLAAAFPGRIAAPATIDAFLAEERLGRKSGRGFYLYPSGKGGQSGKAKRVDPAVYRLLAGRATLEGERPHPEELGERLTLLCACEAIRCLEEGILASADDGDVGAVFGFGYPPMRGGPFHHVDTLGAAVIAARLDRLRERHGDAYAAPELLVELARDRGSFAGHRR